MGEEGWKKIKKERRFQKIKKNETEPAKSSAFHQHDSNGPKIVSNGAQYPQFRTPPIFIFLCLCSTQKQHFSGVFSFSAIFRPNGLGRPPQPLTFQYRTPRSRLVIPSPRDFSAENVFWTQLFGEFQGAVFPVPRICLDIRTFRDFESSYIKGAPLTY